MAQFVAEDAGVEVGLIPEYWPKVFAAFFDIVVDSVGSLNRSSRF